MTNFLEFVVRLSLFVLFLFLDDKSSKQCVYTAVQVLLDELPFERWKGHRYLLNGHLSSKSKSQEKEIALRCCLLPLFFRLKLNDGCAIRANLFESCRLDNTLWYARYKQEMCSSQTKMIKICFTFIAFIVGTHMNMNMSSQ